MLTERLRYILLPQKNYSAKSQRRVFTSNLTPDKWRDFFREEDSLLCALDRTFDAATVYLMKGESYRGRNLKTYSIEISDSVE